MTSLPQRPPVWVNTPQALSAMVQDLEQQKILAVDTESNSLYVYREQVCLVQFSTGQTDYLLDPLAIKDLSALGPLFANPDIEKVFHAAEYDIICLKRDFGFEFNNLFDTMLAARILGRESVGLGAMIKETFGIELDKRYQRANWGVRPLNAALLNYARLDTHFLVDLRDELKQELERSRRWELAAEDFRRLVRIQAPPAEANPQNCFRISGSRDLTPQQLSILQALCTYRDEVGRRVNLPVFKIIGDRALLNITLRAPRTRTELYSVEELSPKLVDRYGEGLLNAVRKGLEMPATRRTNTHIRPNELYLLRLDSLKNWRKETGLNMGVPSDVILPRDVLEQIAQVNPITHSDLAGVMAEIPWRLNTFGKSILALLTSLEKV